MIILSPEDYVLSFDSIEWLIEDGMLPKNSIKDALKSFFEKITCEEAPSEDIYFDDFERLESEESKSLCDILVKTKYTKFSLSTDGDILLITEKATNDSLLITGDHAKKLFLELRAEIENIVSKSQKIIQFSIEK